MLVATMGGRLINAAEIAAARGIDCLNTICRRGNTAGASLLKPASTGAVHLGNKPPARRRRDISEDGGVESQADLRNRHPSVGDQVAEDGSVRLVAASPFSRTYEIDAAGNRGRL
jgi:hypothetical protein